MLRREAAARSRRSRCRADSVAPNQCRPTEPVDRSHPCTAALDYSRDPVWSSPVKPVASSSIPISSFVASVRAPGAFARNDQLSPADSHAANPPLPIVRHDRRWFCLLGRRSSRTLMVMAPQPLRAPAGHAACRCSAAPLFGKRAPLVVAFPRAGSGGAVVVSCSAVQESSTSTTGTVLLVATLIGGPSVLNKFSRDVDRHSDASEMLDCTVTLQKCWIALARASQFLCSLCSQVLTSFAVTILISCS